MAMAMASLRFSFANALTIPTCFNEIQGSVFPTRLAIHKTNVNFPVTFLPTEAPSHVPSVPRSQSRSNPQSSELEDDDSEASVEDLTIPEHWLVPSKAQEESEWLRVTLHKWLDDEYCPEATNVEISNVAARAFYNSLLRKQTDIGEILLDMARELETISYQESFHGAFSSANAAVSLIVKRIEQA